MNIIKNGYVTEYLDNAFLFIQTLVFKLSDLASLANEEVVQKYGVDAVDLQHPETWKYYLNISGEYHPTDTLMRVVSIDTLQEIDFTKENLAIHTATASAYSFGTRDYYALIAKYPTQVRLINGIVNPCDKTKAMEAEDGTILAYRKDLIEANEHTLLQSLEMVIKNMLFRWYNQQFNISSPLYASTFLTQLYMQLVPKFLNLRWERCHTNEVHSFHVRMFLSSHRETDRYLAYLTKEQALWLYRNIRYIERNSGRAEQFHTLIEHLLTKRQIPIGGYSIRHIDEFESYQPKVVARLDLLNADVNAFRDDVQEVIEVYNRELLMEPGNAEYLEQHQEESINLLRRSASTAIQTKVLHSSMIDLTNAVPETYEDVAIREWCHLSNMGIYDAYVSFKDPKTSIVYSVTAEDAFIYLYYISLMHDGYTVTQIPNYLNLRQRRHPKPSVEDLLSVTDRVKFDLTAIAQDLIANQPAILPCHSVSSFNTLITSIYQECYRHWFLISSIEDYYERAQVDNMTNMLFETKRTVLNFEASTIDAWLFSKNLPTYDYSRDEAEALISAIYQAATGVKDDAYARLSNIQKAMISLMTELSSYSIQITSEINEDGLLLINWPAVRLGNLTQSQSDTRYIESEVLIDSLGGAVANHTDLTTNLGDGAFIDAESKHSILAIKIDPVVDQSMTATTLATTHDTDTPMLTELSYDGQDIELDNRYGVIGYTLLNSLTEEQFSNLKSIYH